MSIQLAVITPTPLLGHFAHLGDIHLLLSHLVSSEEDIEKYGAGNLYTAYYQEREELKILDNGLFENHVAEATESLIYKAALVGADAIVAPDVLYDGSATVKSTREFIVEVQKEAAALRYDGENLRNIGIMAVPHGKTPEEYVDCYNELSNMAGVSMIGLSILGIVKSFMPFTGVDSIHINRIIGINYLISQGVFNHNMWHHLLGLGDTVSELAHYRHIPAIKSNDSSSPIVHGFACKRYNKDGSVPGGKIKTKLNFELQYPETKDEARIIEHVNCNIIAWHQFAK